MYNLRPYIKFKNKDIYRKDYDTHSTESIQKIIMVNNIYTSNKKSVKKLKQNQILENIIHGKEIDILH